MSKPKSGDVYVIHDNTTVLMVVSSETEGAFKAVWIGTGFNGGEDNLFAMSTFKVEDLIKDKTPILNIDAEYMKEVILDKAKLGGLVNVA